MRPVCRWPTVSRVFAPDIDDAVLFAYAEVAGSAADADMVILRLATPLDHRPTRSSRATSTPGRSTCPSTAGADPRDARWRGPTVVVSGPRATGGHPRDRGRGRRGGWRLRVERPAPCSTCSSAVPARRTTAVPAAALDGRRSLRRPRPAASLRRSPSSTFGHRSDAIPTPHVQQKATSCHDMTDPSSSRPPPTRDCSTCCRQLTLEEKVLCSPGTTSGRPGRWRRSDCAGCSLRRPVRGPRRGVGRARPLAQPAVGHRARSSWDPQIARRYGNVAAVEARRKGVDIVLGPTINLHRSPLGGRHFECFSEDPVLTAELAAAYVTGVQENGVAATPKHYIANDFETDRFTADVESTSGRCASCTCSPSRRRSSRPAAGP